MKNTLSCASLLILAMVTNFAADETEQSRPPKAKRVFTNEDLNKFGEKYGSETAPTQMSSPRNALGTEKMSANPSSDPKATARLDRSHWVGKLKEAEAAVQKAKKDQAKYSTALEKFEQKHREAQTDFQKTLSQNQVADSLRNLSRATEEVKQAEEVKTRLLAEAAQKGFKPEDLREAPQVTAPQK